MAQPVSSPLPGLPTIMTLDKARSFLHEAISSRGKEVIGSQTMHDQGMGIIGTIRAAIFPGLAAIVTANQGPCFNGSEDTASYQWIRRNPAHMMSGRSGRETPG